MPTPAELLSRYTAQSEISSFFVDKIGQIWVSAYGAVGDGVTDDTLAVQAAVDAAIAAGVTEVNFVGGKTYKITALTNTTGITFLGTDVTIAGGSTITVNSLTTHKAENVTQLLEKTKEIKNSILYSRAISEELTIKLTQSLKSIGLSKTFKVCFWGDSITEGADQYSANDHYDAKVAKMISDKLTPQGVTCTFANYSLGGRTSTQAADPNYVGIAAEPGDGFYRSWSVIGKSWRDHVKDFEPDMVILAHGMNDGGGYRSDKTFYTNIKSICDYMETWTKKPDIVIVPTILPTTDTTRYTQGQEITKAVARVAREYAISEGYNIADAGRLFQILRDGKDDVSRVTNIEDGFGEYPTGWRLQTSDFTLANGVLTPTPGATTKFVSRMKKFYNGIIFLEVKPVSDGSTGSVWIRYREDDLLGSMIVIITAGAGTGSVTLWENDVNVASVAGLTIPSGSFSNVAIVANGFNHKINVNNALLIDVDVYAMMNEGYTEFGSPESVPTFQNFLVDYFDPIECEPLYTEDELLGLYNSTEDGNGINHPTSLGHSLIYTSAFYEIVKALNSNEYGNVKTTADITSFGAGTFEYVIRDNVCYCRIVYTATTANQDIALTAPKALLGANIVSASWPTGTGSAVAHIDAGTAVLYINASTTDLYVMTFSYPIDMS